MYALRCAKNNKKKEKTHFLIFLSKNDMTGGNIIYPNKKNKILHNKKLFIGKITILSYDEYLNNQHTEYIIEEDPIIDHVYILLHKENIYVSYQDYNTLYMHSKMDELENIFINLKASKIIMKEYYSNNEKVDFTTSIDINIPKIEVGNNIELNNEKLINIKRYKEKEFSQNSNLKFNTENFKNEEYYYHLAHNNEWANIISNRLINGLMKDKFIYTHYKKNLFHLNISNKLNFLNIGVNYDKLTVDISNIEYEVEYAELTEKNIKNNNEEEDKCCFGLFTKNNNIENMDYFSLCMSNDYYMEYK
jgi:hypothetical protein